MTLNSNYPGAVRMAPRGKLEGPERGLDALVGLVILAVQTGTSSIAGIMFSDVRDTEARRRSAFVTRTPSRSLLRAVRHLSSASVWP